MGRPIDLTGERFYRLYVIRQAPNRVYKNGETKRCWLCQCDCGNTIVVTTQELRNGDTRSCGCLKTELTKIRLTTHGKNRTHLHNVWKAMRKRCSNVNNKDYCRYGGRGIKVCDEWQNDFLSFERWAINNGYIEGLTIDRVNNDGNYEPNNCRWVTHKDQCNNRCNSICITHNNESHSLSEWADLLNIKYSTLYSRYKKGWDAERILSN